MASTQGDEASARMGESYFAFVARFAMGSFMKSLKSMCGSTQNTEKQFRRDTDDLTKLSCAAVCILIGAYVLAGFSLVAFIVGQAVIALWQITATEYAEHYGMLRKENTGTTEENSSREYVWKANGTLNNALLSVRIEHASSTGSASHGSGREFLELPYGFNLLTIIALWPSRWFALVDARLAEAVNFDLHDVNLDGDAYVGLMEKYHHQSPKVA